MQREYLDNRLQQMVQLRVQVRAITLEAHCRVVSDSLPSESKTQSIADHSVELHFELQGDTSETILKMHVVHDLPCTHPRWNSSAWLACKDSTHPSFIDKGPQISVPLSSKRTAAAIVLAQARCSFRSHGSENLPVLASGHSDEEQLSAKVVESGRHTVEA